MHLMPWSHFASALPCSFPLALLLSFHAYLLTVLPLPDGALADLLVGSSVFSDKDGGGNIDEDECLEILFRRYGKRCVFRVFWDWDVSFIWGC